MSDYPHWHELTSAEQDEARNLDRLALTSTVIDTTPPHYRTQSTPDPKPTHGKPHHKRGGRRIA